MRNGYEIQVYYISPQNALIGALCLSIKIKFYSSLALYIV